VTLRNTRWSGSIESPRFHRSKQGDAAQGDYDIEKSNDDLLELGIKDKGGKINFDVLKSASSYLRGIYLSGELDYLTLKLNLESMR